MQAARVAAPDARFINKGAVVRPLDFLCVGVGNMADLVIACAFFLAGGSGRRRQKEEKQELPALFNLARGSGRRRQKEEKKGLPALFFLLEVLEGAGKGGEARIACAF